MISVLFVGFLQSLAVPLYSDAHLDLCVKRFDGIRAHFCPLRNAIAFDQLRFSTAAQSLMQTQHEDHRTVSASSFLTV